MSLLDLSLTNPFGDQDVFNKSFNYRYDQNTCCISDLPQPLPQRSSFDASLFQQDDEVQFDEHHLENALRDMADSGELEEFLRANTVSLRQIQDDMEVNYNLGMDSTYEEFRTKPRTRRHSIGSTDEIIRCPFAGCDKIFNRHYNFKSHLKIHTGERPYKCSHCEISFARGHDLKRHEKIHKKTTPAQNKCNSCGKNFSRPDALNRHIKFNACQNFFTKSTN